MTAWPDLKVSRARQLAAELAVAVDLWRVAANLRTEFAPDSKNPCIGYLRLRVDEEPSARLWSLLFGDFVHNLRSALDALVWELATQNGQLPANPTEVAFPICTQSTKWTQGRWPKRLNVVPSEFLSRIEEVQPYHKQDIGQDPLTLLSELDILDKHRASVQVKPRTNGVPSTRVHFRSAAHGGSFTPAFLPDAPLRDGVPIVRVESNRQIASLEQPELPPIAIRVILNGRSFEMDHLLSVLPDQVQNTLSYIRMGEPD